MEKKHLYIKSESQTIGVREVPEKIDFGFINVLLELMYGYGMVDKQIRIEWEENGGGIK